MKCPECDIVVEETARFCNQCGIRLVGLCHECKHCNPAGNRFCMACGADLATATPQEAHTLSFDESISTIQKYLPKGLAKKILAQRDRIEGEKRTVTVMFCDLEGFTALSESLGPEGVYALMDDVYKILIHRVHRFEGTVNELTGDGIMALFGAPVAVEDAPQRAIHAALSIQHHIHRFAERMREQQTLPSIRMRIGIHSGPVVVGTLGNDLRVDFKAVGDTVNMASRMQSLAEPGTICVSDETFRLTEGLFRFEALGEQHVKGKRTPLRVYQVIAPSRRRTRFDVRAERGLTPFVGRDREMGLLRDAFERARAGSGQAFSVIGDAGVGKSRFLYEFRKMAVRRDVTFLEGKCLSYGRGIAYHPICELLKGACDIRDDDTEELIRRKVQDVLAFWKVDRAALLPYFLALLAVKDSGIEQIQMSFEGRKEKIFSAVKQLIASAARIRPLVMVIEDLHWADRTTVEIFNRLLDAVSGTNMLIIFTYRTEFVPAWDRRSFHNQVNLNRLSNRESMHMVSHLLGAAHVDTELQQLILGKTEGVPLFIEEFVNSLQALAMVHVAYGSAFLSGDPAAAAIPATIQDMIMAKVDRLSDTARAVLQTGAAIERAFSHELIRIVMDLPETEIISHLSALKDAELLYERGIYPHNTYIFKHALTREVVYDAILAARRKKLHCRIGEAMEAIYRENIPACVEILFKHFSQGEAFGKAAEYAKFAARKAERSASLRDAIDYARKRVLCLEKADPAAGNDRDLIDARTVLGLYLIQVGDFVAAKEAVAPVAGLAREKGHRKRLGQIQAILGTYYGMVEEDFSSALNALEEAIDIAESENDVISLILASFNSGQLQLYDCNFETAQNAYQRAVDINVAAKNLWGIASIRGFFALSHFHKGDVSTFVKYASQALAMAQESADPYSTAICQAIYGISCYARGDNLEEAKIQLLEGIERCERIAVILIAWLARLILAGIYVATEEYGMARDCLGEVNNTNRHARNLPFLVRWAKLIQVDCEVMMGTRDVAIPELCAQVCENRIKLFHGEFCRLMADILFRLGEDHFAEAEQWLKKAIATDNENGTNFNLGFDYALQAQMLNRQGSGARAREAFGKAAQIFSSCGADGWANRNMANFSGRDTIH